MNKLELNISIAKLLNPEAEVTKSKNANLKDGVLIINPADSDMPWTQEVDYCNNWNDLMPLVVEYELLIYILFFISEEGLTDLIYNNNKGLRFSIDSKPYNRALAECLYKVLLDKVGE